MTLHLLFGRINMGLDEAVNESDIIVNHYPNLFKHEVEDCKHTFASIELLLSKGFVPTKDVSDEIIELFKKDEFYLNMAIAENVYVQDLNDYKIMIVVTKSPAIQKMNNFTQFNQDAHQSINTPYYIIAKILLDSNNQLIKNLDDDLPSIVFYRKESMQSSSKTKIILDSYYTFNPLYYSFTDIEDFDYHTSKYTFMFRDYNHTLMAAATHCNTAIELIRLSNSSFYIGDKTYNPTILTDMDDSLDGSDFIDLLRYRAAMNQDKIDLLSMSVI